MKAKIIQTKYKQSSRKPQTNINKKKKSYEKNIGKETKKKFFVKNANKINKIYKNLA